MWQSIQAVARRMVARAHAGVTGGRPVAAGPVAAQRIPPLPESSASLRPPRYAGRRARLATCSSVAWLGDRHIGTVNLLGNAVHTYRFDAPARTFAPVQTLLGPPGLDLPEHLAFSPDGRLVAITSGRGGAVSLYGVDGGTHLIDPAPLVTIRCAGDANAHGVGFSPCSRFLAFTTVDRPGYLRLYRIVREAAGPLAAVPHQAIENRLAPLKPKGIDFFPDGRFVAVCYAPNAGAAREGVDGLLAIYPFAAETGLADRPVSTAGSGCGLHMPDDLCVWPDGSQVAVANQASDTALIIEVDGRTGAFGRTRMTLQNPRARLSFPHGIAVSRDGRYLAIASYGGDSFTIYEARPRPT